MIHPLRYDEIKWHCETQESLPSEMTRELLEELESVKSALKYEKGETCWTDHCDEMEEELEKAQDRINELERKLDERN